MLRVGGGAAVAAGQYLAIGQQCVGQGRGNFGDRRGELLQRLALDGQALIENLFDAIDGIHC